MKAVVADMKLAVMNTVLIFALVLTIWAFGNAIHFLWPILWPIFACLIMWAVIALVMSQMKP